MYIYIAAPLFNEMEIERNQLISNIIETEGFKTYLPQRDGGLFYELRNSGYTDDKIRRFIFDSDYEAVKKCDVILCLLDGRVLDEGMCIELGMAFALGKKCLGYKTDFRSQDQFGNNIMLDNVLSKICHSKDELISCLRDLSLNTELSICI